MEDFPFFQTQDEQFSASGMYFPFEESDQFRDDSVSSPVDAKDDFQKMLFDWQSHMGSFQDSLCDDLDFKLKTEPPDYESPILSNALTTELPLKLELGFEGSRSQNGGEKILFPGDVEQLQISSSIQTDNVLKRITQARSMLINGEKEILGKNIIGLHCLNEIKTSPDQNCQITSAVINGRRIKIIIRPKSSRTNEEASKCLAGNASPLKPQNAPADELISQLQDGDYDVLGHDDGLDSWTLPLSQESDEEPKPETIQPLPEPPRVPPLRIKIPKKDKKRKIKKETETVEKILKDELIFGDFVPLDHDYCSYKRRQSAESILMEKNPRKDSGLESGGVSDASEEGLASAPSTPDPPSPPATTAPDLAQQLATKLLEEKRRSKNHNNVTKMATALFRASNAATSNVTTKKMDCIVNQLPNELSLNCDNTSKEHSVVEQCPEESSNERPKKKLKLEEYRTRRHDREKDDKAKIEPEILPIVDEPIAKNETHEPEVVTDVSPKKIENKRRNSSEGEKNVRRRILRRCSSSSSTDWNHRRRRRNRSISRDRGRGFCSPRRSRSRDSSSSSCSSVRPRSSSARYRRRSRSRSAYRTSRHRSTQSYLKQRRCRSRSPLYDPREKQRQIEERRVVYVGRVPEGTTNQQLRKRFCSFGRIIDISVHFRERGDNYGFVTFAYKDDAYNAVEHGNDDENLPRYDLCFGGRRNFCKQRYSDLDGMPASLSGFKDEPVPRSTDDSFDLLLKQAKAKLHLRREAT